jgi:hypothetical protein
LEIWPEAKQNNYNTGYDDQAKPSLASNIYCVKAAEPPNGPEIATLRILTMQTFLAAPTVPVHFMPSGTWTLTA